MYGNPGVHPQTEDYWGRVNPDMATPDEVTGPINIGNPAEFTIRELAELVLELTGSLSPLEVRPLPPEDPPGAGPTSPAPSRRWAGSRRSPSARGWSERSATSGSWRRG